MLKYVQAVNYTWCLVSKGLRTRSLSVFEIAFTISWVTASAIISTTLLNTVMENSNIFKVVTFFNNLFILRFFALKISNRDFCPMMGFLSFFFLFFFHAEAFVCTFLTSSTDRMLRMHSLASSWKIHSLISTSGSHNVFWVVLSFLFQMDWELKTYLQLHFQSSSLLMLDYFSPEFLVFSSWIYAYFLTFSSFYVYLILRLLLEETTKKW